MTLFLYQHQLLVVIENVSIHCILFAASKSSVKPVGAKTPSAAKPLAPRPSPVRRPALSSPSTRWNPPGKPPNLSCNLGQNLIYDLRVSATSIMMS